MENDGARNKSYTFIYAIMSYAFKEIQLKNISTYQTARLAFTALAAQLSDWDMLLCGGKKKKKR